VLNSRKKLAVIFFFSSESLIKMHDESTVAHVHKINEIPGDLQNNEVGPATLQSIASLQYKLALAHAKLAENQIQILDLTTRNQKLQGQVWILSREKTELKLSLKVLENETINGRNNNDSYDYSGIMGHNNYNNNDGAESGFDEKTKKPTMVKTTKEFLQTKHDYCDILGYNIDSDGTLREFKERNRKQTISTNEVLKMNDLEHFNPEIIQVPTKFQDSNSEPTISGSIPFISANRRGSLFHDSVFHVKNTSYGRKKSFSEQSTGSLATYASAGCIKEDIEERPPFYGGASNHRNDQRLKIPASFREEIRKHPVDKRPHIKLDLIL